MQHSLIYWVRGFVPPSLVETDPSKLGINEIIVCLRFADPKSPSQPVYNVTFAPLLEGLSPSFEMELAMPYESTSEGVSVSIIAAKLTRSSIGMTRTSSRADLGG